MNRKLVTGDEILDLEFRKKVIEEIEDTENLARKQNALKRHEIYRDNTKKYVVDALVQEGLDAATISLMSNRAANISICKKVVEKLARCYSAGVERDVDVEAAQEQLDAVSKLLKLDQKNRKADIYRELFKNCGIYIVPQVSNEPGKYDIAYRVLASWQYDVIENYYDNEKPACVIISDFTHRGFQTNYGGYVDNPDQVGLHVARPLYTSNMRPQGDQRDQSIADTPSDSGLPDDHKTYIWWTDKYHFTTNKNGEIIREISPEDGLNPIERLPFVSIAENQDGSYWAQAGDDIIDGSILINLIVTDILSIAYIQGYGQLVVTGGQDLPDHFRIGPHRALVLRRRDDTDPEPSANYISASPPLDMHMRAAEQYVALLLSTNGLSPTNIASKIDANQFPSGIAMLVENSEATGKIEDKQIVMSDAEADAWQIFMRWQNKFFELGVLSDAFKEIGMIPESKLSIMFNQPQAAITEKERLENLKLKKDLGIIDELQMIIEETGLSEEEAEKRLKEMLERKLEKQSLMMAQMEQNVPRGNEDDSKDESVEGMNGDQEDSL